MNAKRRTNALLDDFELLDGCGSDEDCIEGPSYLGNDELQLEELDALAREVTSADIASSDEGRKPNMHQHFYQLITFHVIYGCWVHF